VVTLDIADTGPQQRLNTRAERVWSCRNVAGACANSILRELGRLGNQLGTRVAGRAGLMDELIQPRDIANAHPRSLSARYGLGTLPFHTELSHRPKPCRYVLLGCIDPGSPAAATMLLDWRNLGFSQQELEFLESTPILVRSGRRSFYSTILAPGGAFLRYDPGCIEALNDSGREALRLVNDRIASATFEAEAHLWHQGDILIIDNWRTLHGRSPSVQGSSRRLARILIDA